MLELSEQFESAAWQTTACGFGIHPNGEKRHRYGPLDICWPTLVKMSEMQICVEQRLCDLEECNASRNCRRGSTDFLN
jgi:hypothetical protein